LDEILQLQLEDTKFAAVIHLAAVSDYSVGSIIVNGCERNAPITGKIDSDSGELIIKLRKNYKILNRIKSYAKKGKPVLVAFKFTVGEELESIQQIISKLKQDSGAELVVWNDANSRIQDRQTDFFIFSDQDITPVHCREPIHLAVKLEEYLTENIKNQLI
jgi:phosphopantothenoylcysteine synthetase/decarboxylase